MTLRLPAVALVRVVIAAVVVALASSAPAAAQTGPALAGSYSDSTTISGATSVAIAGNYAYSPSYYAGELTAIDISNPANPVVAGSSPPATALLNADTVNVAGGYAFVVSKNRNGPQAAGSNDDGTGNSLTILDIHTDPAHPAIVGTVTDPVRLFGAYGIAVSGNYAFVAAQGCLNLQPCPDPSVGNSFDVINIASLSAPSIVATLSPVTRFGHATAVATSGNYAYVTAAYRNVLTVVNIANPASPSVAGYVLSNTALNFPVDVAVKGSYAYVVDQISPGRLTVVDISKPSAPTIVASLANTALNGAYRIRVVGNFAYVAASSSHDIAVVDISNPLNPTLAGSFSDAFRLNKTTGLDVDPTRQYVVATSPYLSTQSNPLYPPYPLQTGGPTSTGTITTIKLDPVPNTVSIDTTSEPGNPTAQTSASFSFSTSDAIATVQCQLDAGSAGPCTSQTTGQYGALGAGSHTFTVTSVDAAGKTSNASYTWTVTPPSNTSAPTISGSAVKGQTLTASPGQWSGSPTYSYQWLQCDPNGQNCTQISGATNQTYTLGSADVGSTVEVAVTGTTSAGSAVASSSTTAVVGSVPQNTGPPTVSGTAAVGQTLTATTGTWTGTPAPTYSYQWLQCDPNGQNCTQISGATNQTYTLRSADAGSTLEVAVTGTNSVGSSVANSGTTSVVASVPQNTAAPTVSGQPAQGQTLTATAGAWTGTPPPTFSYQWLQCDPNGQNCTQISGATNQTYTLGSADVGSTVEVMVTGTNSAGSAVASSSTTAVVGSAPQNTGAPTVSGTAAVGQTLTASSGSWTGTPPPTFTYQWLQCDPNGQNCTQISGATNQTYTLGSADVGSTVEVAVTGTNSAGSAVANSSTTAVVGSVPQNTAAPTVGGQPVEGQTLTATTGTWTGTPAPTYSYQWQRCDGSGANCTAISGAISSTYTIVSADVGSTLGVAVTAANSAGSAQATSTPTGAVGSAVGPVTPLLDDFNRPVNAGPPGSNWSQTATAASNLHIVTPGRVTGYSGNNGDFWNVLMFGPNSEAWITVVTKPTVDLDPVTLGLRQTNPAVNDNGYRAFYIHRATGQDQWRISVTTSLGTTTLASATGPTLNPGDEILFRAIGTTLELWRLDAGAWTKLLSTTNSAYTGAGYTSLTARNATVRLTNFGGGTLP